MFTKILLCTDGSEGALAATRIATEVARLHGAQLTMIHVSTAPPVDSPFPGAPEFASSLLDRYVEDLHMAVVNRTMPIARQADVHCHVLLEVGNPIAVISRTAERCEFDLVVMGSRGTNPDQRYTLGSVSQGVVQRVHCPVLIVK